MKKHGYRNIMLGNKLVKKHASKLFLGCSSEITAETKLVKKGCLLWKGCDDYIFYGVRVDKYYKKIVN